ncbi:UNVERIFIED_ORG: hypothetical protein J2W19_001080 [Shinella zoogloeoides]|nr:hypothetical protein [Shinella zoogloeoides]
MFKFRRNLGALGRISVAEFGAQFFDLGFEA